MEKLLKRNIIMIYISLILIMINQISFAQITATQIGMLDFQVYQNLSEDETNGIIDVTEKLQAAVDSARLSNKTLFIPSGTYKVSNTIHCILEIDNWWLKTPVCIVGSAIDPPVIKLEDNLAAFNGDIPKAVFHYSVSPDTYSTNAVMEGGLRSIDFDLGESNSKAVAIYWGCAQYCFVEDIHINARDGFAGLTSMGGANNLLSNISVTGGQYGIYLPNSKEAQVSDMVGSPQNTINACTFINQQNEALRLRGWGGITLVGIDIVKNNGIAIKMDCGTYAPLAQFPFSIIDSKIEFSSYDESNCAIENLLQGSVSIRGLYVKNSKTICDNNDDEDLVPTGQENEWTAIYRYNYIDKDPRAMEGGRLYEGKHFDAVEGTQYKKAIIHREVSAPPSDLISRHIWASTPSFEDDDAILVTSANEIQSAINSNLKVCIAKGIYELNKPIILKENTILIGCPGRGSCGTIFKYGWTPNTPSWLIETENSASATTYLLDITTNAGQEDYEGSVHWQAGRNSIIRDLRCDKHWIEKEHDYIRLFISGNGGGRIFNYQDEKGTKPFNSNHRKVKVSGTSQQLTFYGLNLERGGSEYEQSEEPMLEIDNSSNIRIFGAKTETSQPYATINDSENIFMTSIIDLSHFRDYGLHYIKVMGNSDKIEITNCMFIDPESSEYKIVDDPLNSNEPDRTMHLGLYHRNWTDHYKSDSSVINGIEQTPVTKKWTIYPNPTTSVITIKSKSPNEKSSYCYIYNSLGTKIKSFELPNTVSTNVGMSNFTSGIYFIQVQSIGENLECFKIMKN